MNDPVVLFNGVVHTLDDANSLSEAIAIGHGRVIAVGTSQNIRNSYSEFNQIDLQGAHVYPAFVDAHAHPLGVGERLLKPRLESTRSKEEVYNVLGPLIPTADWIVSRGWDQNVWADKQLPDKSDLDRNVSDIKPIALTRIDGHAVWCNSEALRRAGIDRSTTDPLGGAILHDTNGEPTGILLDEAMKLVEIHIPPATADDLQRTLRAGLREFLRHGIATVHDMGVSHEVWNAYTSLYASNFYELPHAYVFLDMTKPTGKQLFLEQRKTLANKLSQRLHFAGIKLYLDGALGSRGAHLFEEYSDDPGNRGLALMEDDEAIHLMKLAAEMKLQIAVHAIGDRACSRALDLFERAGLNGQETTLRIEHAQIMRKEDIQRIASMGVYGLVQPAFYKSDRHWAVERLGHDRMKTAYRWQSLVAAGVRFIASSDAPIEDTNVFDAIRLLTTRDGVSDGEALNAHDALSAYCKWPYLLDKSSSVRVENGYSARLTITNADVFEDNATVLATIIDGSLTGGSL